MTASSRRGRTCPGGINNHDDAFVARISDTTSTSNADLSLTMTDSPDPAAMGSNVTYTLTVANAGQVTATAVSLTVRPNSSFRIISVTPGQGSCGTPDALNTFTCNLASIFKNISSFCFEYSASHPRLRNTRN